MCQRALRLHRRVRLHSAAALPWQQMGRCAVPTCAAQLCVAEMPGPCAAQMWWKAGSGAMAWCLAVDLVSQTRLMLLCSLVKARIASLQSPCVPPLARRLQQQTMKT